MRSKRLVCVLLALILCAGCSAAPQTPAETPAPEPTGTHVPTFEPSPEPTPEPTSEPTPEPTPEPITDERIESGEFDGYFDDTLFVGDSLTNNLSNYVRWRRQDEPGLLGTAKMFGVSAMTIKVACQDMPFPFDVTFRYRGKAVSVTELIRANAPKRVFLMLGSNEIGSDTLDEAKENYAKLIDVIREKCPETELIVQAILPATPGFCQFKGLDGARWNSINESLSEICAEHGAAFWDFSEILMDEDGYLQQSFANDHMFHLNRKGEDVWIYALRLYAARQMYPDAEPILSGKNAH